MIKTYAFSNKNNNILYKSSSGGAFYVLSHWVLVHGGVVFGVSINSEGFVHHKMVDDITDIEMLMTSKYVKSDTLHTYLECCNELKKNRLVLYSGTPCQISALKTFLEVKKCPTKTLITTDVICHGAPNKKYWDMYLDYLKDNNIAYPPYSINFRYKDPSWEDFSIKINGLVEKIRDSKYGYLFINNYILSNSCYCCKWRGENHVADVTLGDYWGCFKFDKQHYNELGTSLVIIRNKLELIRSILGAEGYLEETSIIRSTLYNKAYWESPKKPVNYSQVMENFSFDNFSIPKSNKKRSVFASLKNVFTTIINTKLFDYSIDNTIKRKKKNRLVGIITLVGYENYGNRLQNYALISILKKHGYKPYNLIPSKYSFAGRLPLKLLKLLNRKRKVSIEQKRESLIKKSARRYEKNFFYYYTHRSKKMVSKFDCLIFGSDQVWYRGDADLFYRYGYYGLNNNNEPKKVAYAAGFTASQMDDWGKACLTDFLSNFESVSVREFDSSKLLSDLGIPNIVTLDPTLLLTKQDWDSSIRKYSAIDIPKQKYILVYVLGDEKWREYAQEYARSHNLLLIDMFDRNTPFYLANQFDFINLIKNSEYVVTDSYHCVIFSLLFNTNFKLLERNNSNGMEKRFDIFDKLVINKKLDGEKLAILREESIEYLLNSIKQL